MLAEAAELSALDPRRGPLPAVLDTGFIRTGLEDQLKKGKVPASVWSAQDGSLRLFMEYDTLIETDEKLPKFADQLGVTVSELRRILNQDWLPNIEVVRLPPTLRKLAPGRCSFATATPMTSPRPRWPPCSPLACCSPTTRTSASWASAAATRAAMVCWP